MNKRRLLKLAELLEADAKNKKGICFDMSLWGAVDDEKQPLSCGTTACAFGLAGLSGVFRRAGLTTKIEDGMLSFKWKGRETKPVEAAAKLFEIELSEARQLFMSWGEHLAGAKGEREKAQEIRQFVASGGR